MTSQLRPFSEWLTDHAQGVADAEATAALAEVVEAVAHHGKAGTVTIKVKVEPAGSSSRTVVTSVDVKANTPEPAAEQSIFYVGEGGGLHRDDPYQGRLLDGAREIDTTTGEVRHIESE
jgi:hypothetical protein